MPYNEDGSDVPDRIKSLSPKKRRMWAKIWNSAFQRCKSGSAPRKQAGESCETYAFRIANGVLKRQGTEREDDDTMPDIESCPCDEVLAIEDFTPEMLAEKSEGGDDALDEFEEGIPKELAWSTAKKNDLPNAAFAVVEGCWKTNKSARHLPHHKSSVKSPSENSSIDMPHLRNALARMNQIKSVCGGSDAAVRSRAKSHLTRHAKVVLPSSKFQEAANDPSKLAQFLTEMMDAMDKKKLEFTQSGWKMTI